MDCRRRVKRPRLEFQQYIKNAMHCGHQNPAELQFIRGKSALPVIDSEVSCCEAKELTLNRIKLLHEQATKSTWGKATGAKTFLQKLSLVLSGYEDYVNSDDFQEKRRLELEEDQIRREHEIVQEELRCRKILMEKVMLNHLISKEIFKFLSVKDLLNVSLVCKSFYEPTRTCLRRDKKCFIEINWVNSCDKLGQLTSLLRTCKIIPYNGLNLSYSCSHSCYNHGSKAMAHADLLLKNFTSIKYLKLMEWPVFKDCPIFFIVRKLLTMYSKNLVEIELGTINSIGEGDITTINELVRIPPELDPAPQPSSPIVIENLLPNVRQLTLPTSGLTDNIAALIRQFIRASPNLQIVVGCVVPKLTEPLVTNKKVEIVKEFRFANLTSEEVNLSLKFGQAGAKIEKMIVDSSASRFSTPLRTLKDTLRLLYETSQNSLKILNISHADLLMFLGNFMPVMTNVQEINLYYNSQYDELGYFIVGKIDLSSKFPNLDRVIVDRSHCSRFFSDRNDLRQWNGCPNFSSTSVSKIKFNDEGCVKWDPSLVSPFSIVFPNVTHVNIHVPTGLPTLFQTLWTVWPHLITITLTKISDETIWKNMDSEFTGISEENCQYLRETGNFQNYQRLKVKSSITDLKRLKLLRLHIEHDASKCKLTSPKDVFLTNVTANCAFSPMLLLTVLIGRNKCHNLPHGRECHLAMEGIRHCAQFYSPAHSIPKEWNF